MAGRLAAFSYVGDVAPLVAECIRIPAAWNETINLGSDEIVTVRDLAMMVQHVLGRATGIVFCRNGRKCCTPRATTPSRLEFSGSGHLRRSLLG